MAIVQISRIQIRRGLQQDLPQLASAEMGWSLDSQRLYIGNGLLSEGAPKEGVTEILTENSIINFTLGFSSNLVNAEANILILQSNVSSLQSNAISTGANTVVLDASTSGVIRGVFANDAVISYTLNQGGSLQRRGAINFSRIGSGVIYQDDYTETAPSDLVLSVTGNTTAANLNYTTTTSTIFTYTTSIL